MTELPGWHGRGEVLPLAEGGSLYHEVEGAGPGVLVVGGGPGNDHTHYHPWFSALATSHAVVYYDHPGTGRSTGAAEAYTLERYASAIEQLRAHLHLDRISLVGVSFGGLPAVEYAQRHADRVSSLVLSNAHVDATGWQQGNIDHVNQTLRQHYPELWRRLLDLRERGVRSLDPEYQDLVGRALPRLEWADPDHRPPLLRDRPFADAAYAAFIGPDPEWEVGGTLRGYAPALETLRCPTLVLTGRHDGLTLPSIAAECAARVAGSRWRVFEHSGHRPWAEEPTAYFETVQDFLAATD